MQFDPQAILDATFNEANSTELIPVPEGEYQAVAGEVETATWQGVKDPSKSGVKLIIPWEILDDGAKAHTKRQRIIVRQDIMLDLNANGLLDMREGQNIRLGQLRAALGLNTAGQPFSPRMISGRMARVRVGVREHEGRKFEEVKAVAKA